MLAVWLEEKTGSGKLSNFLKVSTWKPVELAFTLMCG